jgi:hemoglobin
MSAAPHDPRAAGEAADARTVFAAAGGEETFRRIVAHFYAGVSEDPLLRPLYPENLDESERHLTLFLVQYFGGPSTYSQQRGHPRLRMRHLPFTIGQAERDAWMRHMTAAVEAERLPQPLSATLLDYFDRAATFLMNR